MQTLGKLLVFANSLVSIFSPLPNKTIFTKIIAADSQLRNFVRVVRVNHDEHPEWASETRIKFIPGIMAVVDGVSYVYDDQRDAQSILKWIRSLVPDVTTHLSTLDDKRSFDSENFDRTLFYLLSNEQRPSFYFKALAYRLRNDASMAFISSKSSKQFTELVCSFSFSV